MDRRRTNEQRDCMVINNRWTTSLLSKENKQDFDRNVSGYKGVLQELLGGKD